MKNLIKKLIQKTGYYEHLKYSNAFRGYEDIFKPNLKKQRRNEVEFYSSFLKNCNLIFDIGAYDGHKTEAFLQLAQKVVCCEPDSKNYNTLNIRFRNNTDRVFIENKAVASNNGRIDFFIHHPGSAFNTLNSKFKKTTESDNLEKWNESIQYIDRKTVSTTTLDDLIQKYGKPEFIKVDVEGSELEVLKGLHQRVPFLSLECLLPDFAIELEEEIELLLKLDPQSAFNIAINEKLVFPSFMNEKHLRSFLKSFKDFHFELIVKMSL